MILRFLAVTVIASLLSACSMFQTAPKPPAPKSVQAITQWDTEGRVGIRTPNDAVSGNFNWHESPTEFSLNIYGPFGQGATKLSGVNGKKVTLAYEDKTIVGKDAASLLKQKLGWEFPVNQVTYWMRGLPYPYTPYQSKRNPKTHLLEQLQQDGWKITYKKFSKVEGLQLPQTMQVARPPYRVNLIITDWTVQ
ncbi:Outer-membrane lipoprotein LolB precursor [Marinomonas spartinae]|uniref:Outer-membrane lipoprotein LolB n=1 Tax=Marinomonas spartinae TaxID=1792290 RepID=A0A1A8THE3_9GAMM|nr:lipoprotein insertase outer membrane protein LolB [Marinomonas spartinae]SBS26752.1 Outer-membrane lipoprotein LolB precursor [Marinomonas spartinae]SBS32973.1 Outer-membrane lipoprotein LolB precursor [Marinomonas spartinae]